MATALLGDKARSDVWSGPIIDVDVHAVVPSLDEIEPYMDDFLRGFCAERNWRGPPNAYVYPPGLISTARPEWKPEDGRPAASSVDLVRQHVLDPWDVDYAIVNCQFPIDLGHPDVSAAFARAINDWLIAEWLDEDPRLRGSIVLPSRVPELVAAEIDRVGDHPAFVQAILPVRSGRGYGHRMYHPIYAALCRHDLVLGLHWGGANDGLPPTPSGWPSWYVEEYAAEIQVYEAQITSLVSGGVFQQFPDLRATLLEGGFLWLPQWAWRLDKEWKGMRREIPWVNRTPFSIIRDHMRFSVAPTDAGPPAELNRTIGWLQSDDILLFATDYPHYHDDDLATLLDAVPESMRPKLMAESAREWYRLG